MSGPTLGPWCPSVRGRLYIMGASLCAPLQHAFCPLPPAAAAAILVGYTTLGYTINTLISVHTHRIFNKLYTGINV